MGYLKVDSFELLRLETTLVPDHHRVLFEVQSACKKVRSQLSQYCSHAYHGAVFYMCFRDRTAVPSTEVAALLDLLPWRPTRLITLLLFPLVKHCISRVIACSAVASSVSGHSRRAVFDACPGSADAQQGIRLYWRLVFDIVSSFMVQTELWPQLSPAQFHMPGRASCDQA